MIVVQGHDVEREREGGARGKKKKKTKTRQKGHYFILVQR
jgi:hypothetical protein